MHRATPANTSFRAYSGGGARSCVHEINDSPFMQEMKGNFMKGESRDKIESPQNYGFTSVVSDADKDGDGNVTGCAEAFMMFCGGSRSMPVAAVMDDRRHRLNGLEKGDTAMFRQRDDSQQFHMTKDGGFWSGPTEKTVRMQLVDGQQQQQQGGGSARAGTSQGGGGGGQGGQQQNGQKAVYKDGQKSYRFVDVTKGATRISGTESHMMLSDGDSYVHCVSEKSYLGGHASKHKFAKVVTVDGPAYNVLGRIDGGGSTVLTVAGNQVVAQSEPKVGRILAPHRVLVPALMLLLGLSIGVNYSLVTQTSAGSAFASACRMVIASR